MKYKVSIVQDAPIFFDKEATLDKMLASIKSEAEQESKLIVFPESYLPGYPRGFSFGAVIGSRSDEGRALYADYYENSISQNGSEMGRLTKASAEYGIYIVFGFTEKIKTNGSLYCSVAYISPTDGLLGVHRKIKPTGTERLIWAEAGGESLVTFDTKIGILGGLICWENYMPEARLSMYRKGVQIYIAPTADSRDAWTTTLRHIALEGRCFVLGSNQYMTKSMYPAQYQKYVKNENEKMCLGGSIIVSPMGEIIEGPLVGKAGILRAELDLNEVIKSKLDFDTNGHYRRNDIFDLHVKGQPNTRSELGKD